jgi:hypothetical protein
MCKEHIRFEENHVILRALHQNISPELVESYVMHTACWSDMSACVEDGDYL